MVFEVFHDGAFELRDALEGAAADTFSGDLSEEPLDHVSQEAEVGVKCKWKRGWALSQRFTAGVLCVA